MRAERCLPADLVALRPDRGAAIATRHDTQPGAIDLDLFEGRSGELEGALGQRFVHTVAGRPRQRPEELPAIRSGAVDAALTALALEDDLVDAVAVDIDEDRCAGLVASQATGQQVRARLLVPVRVEKLLRQGRAGRLNDCDQRRPFSLATGPERVASQRDLRLSISAARSAATGMLRCALSVRSASTPKRPASNRRKRYSN